MNTTQSLEKDKKSNNKESSQKRNEVEKKDQTWGLVSLICGMLSLFIPIVGVFFAIFAIIAYFMQKKITQSTVGLIGLILGIISISLYIIGFFIMIFVMLYVGVGMGMMF